MESLQSSELEKLSLLNAVIRETLRLYPPAASPVFSRMVPEGGVALAGYILPSGVSSLCRALVDGRLESVVRRGQSVEIRLYIPIPTPSSLEGLSHLLSSA